MIDDVNEAPVITSTVHTASVPEDQVNSILMVDIDASDPDADILSYQITNMQPTGGPFAIDNTNGEMILFTSCSGSSCALLYFPIPCK